MKSLALVFLFALLLWGGEYARRDLWEPDEARFAYVTREMQQNGHWAVPHRHGEFYAHKPPLLFWLQRFFSLATGGEVNRVSARLPSLVGAVLTLWLTGLFAVRWLGEAARWKAILILATSAIFWHEGGMGRMDALLCALQMSALYLLLANDETPAAWRPLTAYACLGLAILTKGPVGLLVPLGVYVAVTWTSKGLHALAKGHLAWGPILALLFPAAWFLAAWMEGAPPAYFKELLFKQNLARVTGEDGFGKPRPFYFYLVHLPVDFMPWTLFLPAAAAAFRLTPAQAPVRRRLFAWILLVAGFFTLSSGKRNLYILLAYPALSLLLAGAWEGFPELRRGWKRAVAAIAVVLLGAIAMASAGCFFYKGLPLPAAAFAPGGAVALAGAMLCFIAFRRRGLDASWFYGVAAAFVLFLVCTSVFVFHALNPLKTPRAAVAEIQSAVRPDEKLLIYGETTEIVPLYCERFSRNAMDVPGLKAQMSKLGRGALICRQSDWEGPLSGLLPGTGSAHQFGVGRKTMVWVPFEVRRE